MDEQREPDKVIRIGPLEIGLFRRTEPIPEFQRLADAVEELKATIWRERVHLLEVWVAAIIAVELVILGGHALGFWDAGY